MGALISWEYIHQFGTDRLRDAVDLDMEPSSLKRSDYEHGTYSTEDFEGAIHIM